jgi:hypothetical protein
MSLSTPTTRAIAEAEVAINTASPNVVASLPPTDVDVDVDDDANANTNSETDTRSNNHPRATDPSTSTSAQAIKFEPKTAPAPTNPSTDQAEASIPTETVINGPNLNHTVIVRRKAAKRSEKWYKDIAAPLPPSPQAEDIPARKKPRIKEEPRLPLRRSSRRVNTSSSTGTPAAPAPNASTVAGSTLRRSPRRTQLPRTETSEEQLDDNDEDEDANPDDTNAAADDLPDPFWKDRLSELADYHKMHGHCNVPVKYSENTKLGTWVKTQRTQFRWHLEGKSSQMTTLRIQELEELGFEWNCRGAAWGGSLSELAD